MPDFKTNDGQVPASFLQLVTIKVEAAHHSAHGHTVHYELSFGDSPNNNEAFIICRETHNETP